MTADKKEPGADLRGQVLEDARRHARTYRERALKLFPWVCARCGREFSGKKLRELTVHHKDHNHRNNPLDGSNWELLCLYCHDNEHARSLEAEWYAGSTPEETEEASASFRPFAGLGKPPGEEK